MTKLASSFSQSTPPTKLRLLKWGALLLLLVLAHSLWLWWSLTPHPKEQSASDALAELRAQRSSELPKQASGDLFVKGRQRQEATPSADAAAVEEEKVEAGDYQLQAIISANRTYYALFANKIEQQKLTLGDTLPNIGIIRHIDQRSVVVEHLKQQEPPLRFTLFPVVQPSAKEDE